MVFHRIYQSWSWTGGHADDEDDLLSVAVREANEETGVTCAPIGTAPISLEVIGVPPHYKKGACVSAHLHYNLTFLLTANSDAPLTVKPDENSGVQWFSLNDTVAACCEPEMKPIYQKLNKTVVSYQRSLLSGRA